jgi:hypothetical protein
MIDLQRLPAQYIHFRQRWADRNERMRTIIEATNGEFGVDDPSDDAIDNRSPNVVQVALEDTAEAASLVPTVRVSPSGPLQADRDRAIAMERMAISYLDASQVELLTIRTLMDLAAHGMNTVVVVKDPDTGGPVIQWRDPQTCFPEPGWKTMDSTKEAFFARELYFTQLPEEYQRKIEGFFLDPVNVRNSIDRYFDKKVLLIEYFAEDDYLIAAMYQTNPTHPGGTVTYLPIELERGKNPGHKALGKGINPVVVSQRFSLDNEPRGQFDQVIGLMRAHIRLMGMVLDYADQAVYSDVWVKDLIGPLNFGGGAYIQLGPNGNIGRVPPAVSDVAVFQEMAALIDAMHLGGRWPKSRPGEIDQAIASAKFLEATAGVMNTVIRTYHLIMKRMWERALRVAFVIDAEQGEPRMISGVLRNQQFMAERNLDDIDLKARLRVEYGLGLGRDPAQAMVLGIQASQAGFVSHEFVQENFEGITDVALERERIDVENLRSMAFARLLQGLEQGQIPPEALVQIAKDRQKGEDIFELFDKYVVQPQQAQAEQQLTSGLTGQPLAPGQAPEGAVPPAPGPEELLGALTGAPPSGTNRLSVPLGGGSFAGTEVQTGPPA